MSCINCIYLLVCTLYARQTELHTACYRCYQHGNTKKRIFLTSRQQNPWYSICILHQQTVYNNQPNGIIIKYTGRILWKKKTTENCSECQFTWKISWASHQCACMCLMTVFDGSILPVQLTLSFFIPSDEIYGFCFVYFNLLIAFQTQEKQHNFQYLQHFSFSTNG